MPSSLAPNPQRRLPGTHAIWRYTRTLAFAARGQTEKASAEREEFAKEAAAFPAVRKHRRVQPWLRSSRHGRSHPRRAHRRRKRRQRSQYRALARSIAVQDTLNYDEPPDWYYPVRESLGAALLDAGNPVEAEKIFRDDLASQSTQPALPLRPDPSPQSPEARRRRRLDGIPIQIRLEIRRLPTLPHRLLIAPYGKPAIIWLPNDGCSNEPPLQDAHRTLRRTFPTGHPTARLESAS